MNILFTKFNIIVILKLSQNWKHYWAIRNERKTKYELVVAYTQAYMKTKLPFHDEIQYNYVQRKNNFEYLFRQWKKKKKKKTFDTDIWYCVPPSFRSIPSLWFAPMVEQSLLKCVVRQITRVIKIYCFEINNCNFYLFTFPHCEHT